MENPSVERVIGIGFGNNGDGQDVYDICAHCIPEMSNDFITRAKEIKDELGYFKNPTISNSKDYRKKDFKGFGLWWSFYVKCKKMFVKFTSLTNHSLVYVFSQTFHKKF